MGKPLLCRFLIFNLKINYKSNYDETLHYLLRAQFTHCGQISDRLRTFGENGREKNKSCGISVEDRQTGQWCRVQAAQCCAVLLIVVDRE